VIAGTYIVNTWVDQLVVVGEKLNQLVHSQPQKPCLVPIAYDHPHGNAQTTSLEKKILLLVSHISQSN